MTVTGGGPSHARYEAIFHFAPDAIIVCASDGTIVACNEQVTALFGHGPERLVGAPVELLLHPRHHDVHVAHRARFQENPRPRAMGAGTRLDGLRADGTAFPVEISLSPVPGRSGEVMAAIRDVSERVQEQERVRAMMDFTPDATLIVGEGGTIRFASRQVAALFGHRPETLIGASVDVLLPAALRGAHEAHRDGYFASPRVREMGVGTVLHGLHADGTEFPVEVSLSPLPGEPRAVMAAVRDVSQRRLGEERARAIVEFAPDATIIVDSVGTIVQANRQAVQLFGHELEDLLDLQLEALLPERFRWSHVTHRDTYFTRPRVREMGAGADLYGLRADGTEVAVEISLSPLPGPEQHVMATIRDVTERRAAQEALQLALRAEQHGAQELRDAGRLKDEFLGIVGHELRTPLAAIMGFSDLLHEQWDDFAPDVRVDLLARLRRNATQMSELIERLLDMSRLQAGRVRVRPTELDLPTVVADIVAGLEPLRDRHVAVTVEVSGPLVSDASALRHVLANFLTNAAKFSPAESTIDVRVVDDTGGVLFEVVDRGIGVPADDLPHLFEHFFQGGNQSFGGRGVGVGLNVARRYSELLGGRIWADSTEGAGSTFAMWLPRDPEARTRLASPNGEQQDA